MKLTLRLTSLSIKGWDSNFLWISKIPVLSVNLYRSIKWQFEWSADNLKEKNTKKFQLDRDINLSTYMHQGTEVHDTTTFQPFFSAQQILHWWSLWEKWFVFNNMKYDSKNLHYPKSDVAVLKTISLLCNDCNGLGRNWV